MKNMPAHDSPKGEHGERMPNFPKMGTCLVLKASDGLAKSLALYISRVGRW